MPYLTRYGETQKFKSWLKNDVGFEVVGNFSRSWTMTEVDAILFTVIAPTEPIEEGRLYEIWADSALTKRLATAYVISPGAASQKGHPVAQEYTDSEILVYDVIASGPTQILKRKLINMRRANIRLDDLARGIITKAGLQYGISPDYSFILPVNVTVNVDYKDQTPFGIFEDLRALGTGYYVDDDLRFHFFEDNGEVLGYAWDEKTSYIEEIPLSKDISELRNAVKIIGADRSKPAPDFSVVGTGDLTTGLDFLLPNNVKFQEDQYFDDWNEVEPSVWDISDSRDSNAPTSPDRSRIYIGNSSIHIEGGNGFWGSNYINKTGPSERIEGNAIVQTLSFSNFGEGFVLAYGDGNGGKPTNLAGFLLTPSGELLISEYGTIIQPSQSFRVKRSFAEGDNVFISGLSNDRKTFSVPSGITAFFQAGDIFFLIGNVIGIVECTVESVTGNQIRIIEALPAGDIANTKLTRLAIYRLIIQVKAQGFIYKIQGEQFGRLNAGIYQNVYESSNDETKFLFPVPCSVRTPQCVIDIENTFVNPAGGATFRRDGQTLLVAPEDIGSAFDFPVLIRPADPRRNPPLLRYRPQRFIATVANNTSTTTIIPLSEDDYRGVLTGDRLLVNKKEAFVKTKLTSPYRIEIEPALAVAPEDGDQLYIGTTAAAEGQIGTLTYNYPVSNRRFFRNLDSIQEYGLIEQEPISDNSLRTTEDLQARYDAFKEAKSTPKIVGTVKFQARI